MRELIDKQNTIDIIMGEPTDLHYPSWYAELIKEIQPEEQQKKGKWIRVGGYVTPGGDPVWRCSNCGKANTFGELSITHMVAILQTISG